MFIKIGPEFQYLKGQDQNANIHKNRNRNPVVGMLAKIKSEYKMFIKIG